MTDLFTDGFVTQREVREANGFPGAAVDYLPNRPVPRGGIHFPIGRRFRRDGPPPVKPSAKRRYGRG